MDPTFSTVNGRDGNFPPASDWQAQCGFTGAKSKFPAERDQAPEPIFMDSSETAQTDLPQEEQEPDEKEQTEGEVGDKTEEKGAPESEGNGEEGTRPEGETGKKERSEGGIPNPPGDEATTDSDPPKGNNFKVDLDLPQRGRRDRGKITQSTFAQ